MLGEVGDGGPAYRRVPVLAGLPGQQFADGLVAAEAFHEGTLGGQPEVRVLVLVGNDGASAVYVRNKIKACAEVGIASEQIALPVATTTSELLACVKTLNTNDKVDGILVQLPLPAQIEDAVIIEAIDPAKDVDAFHPLNVGLLALGRPRFVPASIRRQPDCAAAQRG